MYLPFGLRSPPFLFNHLSDDLEWILKNNYGIQRIIHILDDFFIAERSKLACLTSFSTLLRVFMSLKAPVVASKTIGPSQEIEFTGIVLDSICMEARLPQDKLSRLNKLLNAFQKCGSVCLVELQSLIGTHFDGNLIYFHQLSNCDLTRENVHWRFSVKGISRTAIECVTRSPKHLKRCLSNS